MAVSLSPISYLNASAYQSLPPATSASATGASTGISATDQVKALQRQGDFKAFLNDSIAAALLQPSDGMTSGVAANTLINNMLQQVLGAYQASSSANTS